MSQVTQRQTKMRQPVLIDEYLAVFRFEGRNQLLRFWIKLVVQQVYDSWCKMAAIPWTMVPMACHDPRLPQ